MKTFRRLILLLALLVTTVSVALLVTNYDPSNPTNRRYSSETVITTGDDQKLKGDSAEKVLAKDLGIPRNDLETPRLIVCNRKYENKPPPEKNTKCIYYSDDIKDHNRPDFVSDDIIAESKNRRVWYKSDLDQIRAFAVASKGLNRPLWVYVRHNTEVPEEYHDIVNSTGGRIVYYFATDGYVNPIDFSLFRILASALGVMVVILLWEMLAGFFTFSLPTIRQPKSSVAISEHKTSRNARNAVEGYDQFMRNAGDNARNTLDK